MSIGQYVQVKLDGRTALTVAVDLPPELQGRLSDHDLADLGWTDSNLNFIGTGFFRITTIDSSAITAGMVESGTSTFTIDPVSPTVLETLGATPMSEAQLAAAQAALISSASNAITTSLNDLAVAWGYTDITSAATYLNSAVAQFKAEAESLTAWRDQVWYQAGVIQAEPAANQPTTTDALWAAIIAAAPVPTKPTV